MSQRVDYYTTSPDLSKKLFELSGAVKKGSLGNTLLDLVNIRASQLNGCARCLDMHISFRTVPGSADEMLGLTKAGLK
jgi:alkylhydroperoxidase family enzyme